MLLKKKKILNVKYKRKQDSSRLLDKQFSITDSNQFKINIKGTNYFFKKTGKSGTYEVISSKEKARKINVGSSLRLVHKDGSDVYFDLYDDFLYALDYGMYAYVAFSILLNLGLAFIAPSMDMGATVSKQIEENQDDKRIKDLLGKLTKTKKLVVKARPTTTTRAPVTTTTRAVVKKSPPITRKRVAKAPPKTQPRKRNNSLSRNKSPRPNAKKRNAKVVQVNDKRKMKRLVVQKGPPKRGGTGPKNPNAKGNTAARAQAVKLAKTKSKVSGALNFLTKGKGDFNIPPGSKGGSQFRTGSASQGLAGAKNVKGTNFLAKVTGKNKLGSSSGSINTRGSRTVASGQVLSNGEINGIEGGRSYNYVQGKVSVKGLHAAGGSGGGFKGLGPQSMSVKGGKMSQSLIRKIIAKHMGKLTYCYEKSLLSNPNLSGIVNISWKIAPGGRVSGTRVVKSQMNNQKLHGCLTGVISQISFAPGPKGGAATVVYPFNFTASML